MSCKYVFGIIELILRETTNRELIFLLVFTSISKFKEVNESEILIFLLVFTSISKFKKVNESEIHKLILK